MVRKSTRANRQKDKLRKQRLRTQVVESFVCLSPPRKWKMELLQRLDIQTQVTSVPNETTLSVPLTTPTTVHKITPDGNCLFNALSYVLTGSEKYHHHLRQAICNYIKENHNELVSILPSSANGDVLQYLRSSHMEFNGTWGTEVELYSASALFQANIFVYSKSGVHWKWIKHSPFHSVLNYGIYLYHDNGNHFDVVVGTQNSNIFPHLPPTEYSEIRQKRNRYQNDDAFRERKKEKARQNMNKKYKLDEDFRKEKLKKDRQKYATSNTFMCYKKQNAKRQYHENISIRSSKKLASITKYCFNTSFRHKMKTLSKQKYLWDLVHQQTVKTYSRTKYFQNANHKQRVKDFSKKKYSENNVHQQRVKDFSRTKYSENIPHQQRVKDFSRTKYSENIPHQQRVKDYSKKKYSENILFQQKKKDLSKKKYAENTLHQQKVKDYSKRKYKQNIVHKVRVKEYSKTRYQRFSSFRKNLKASSVKKYANNPLFRSHLKSMLKERYHRSITIRQKKKYRVTASRHSITKSVQRFKDSVKKIPEYICIVCVRLLYRNQVKKCKRQRYFVDGKLNEKASQCLNFPHNFRDLSEDEWICDTCDRHLKAGNMPPQAQANSLALVDVPPVLSSLNELERQLISLRIPFMKMLSLPRGGQKGVKGPVVNVPSDISSVTSSLPRNIDDAQLIKVKLKRKLSYKGYYKYKWINPNKVIQALKLMIAENLWFDNIKVDESWLQNITDSELVKESDDNDSDSDSDSETNVELDKTFDLPVETCFQPVDVGQDILDSTKTLCIAPAEKEKPQNIFQENGSDAMAFPTLLPDGHFGLFENREIKLTPSKYFNARLFSADCRFSSNKEFIFFAQYVTEINQISSNISLALRKGKQNSDDGNPLTASMLLDSDQVSNILKSDIGYRFLQPVRGTPPYWQRTMKDLYAMLHQLGIPTWFVTFSAAEMRWDEVVQTLLFLNNDKRKVEDIEWQERCSLVTNNPVITARMFDHRVKALFSDLIMSPSCPVGKVEDYFFRTEFQQRGSPHIHCLLWIHNAPKFNENTDAEVCKFIDQYVTCKMPDPETDPELHEIISSVQIHSKNHSKSCKKYSTTCRFNFPRPPVFKTFIARSQSFKEKPTQTSVPTAEELDKMSQASARKPREILRDIWMLVSAAEDTNFSFKEILQLVNVTYAQFKQCLIDVSTRNTVHLKRQLSDVWVNNYNEHLSRAWNANLDIQFVTDSYACVAYILSYISKAETEIGDLLRNAQQEADEGNQDATSAMRKIGNTYIQNREVSAQEAVYRVCGLHLKDCTREVVFVPAGSNIIKMSLPISLIKSRSSQNGDHEQNIWMTSLHEKYHSRPKIKDFDSMCMAEFCSKFRFLPKSQKPKSTELLPVFELNNKIGTY